MWIGAGEGSDALAVTTDGGAAGRVKNGTASWVYGEELSQRTAMWWSPDSRKLAYYRFDERDVRDYHVALDQTRIQNTVDTEAFPTAGMPNPKVDLYVYDVATRQSVRIDVRSGRTFDNDVVGHYVYRVAWSADGRELLFLRTNRRQNVMELAAANPATGACRVVLREEWPTGWLMSEPRMVFLADGSRFIWESQRNGWNNFYLYDLSGRLIAPLTSFDAYEADKLVKIDETAGVLFYTARDGDNPLKLQLHRVGLDGSNDRRLTDPAFHHVVGNCIPNLGSRPEQPALSPSCGIAPDSTHFVDVYQTHDTPAAARLVSATDGHVVSEIAKADASRLETMGLRRAELFTFTAADGATTLRGMMQFPARFDQSKVYPALVGVYGGPEFDAVGVRESFVGPAPLAEYGFLIVSLESRAVPGRGKRTLDGIYQKLGQAEIDDMAEGVKALWSRSYVDRNRVGIFGSSVRRLRVGDGTAPPSRRIRRRGVVVADDRLAQLRHHLHGALHVDPAGEQGGLRLRQRADVREGFEGTAADLLRNRRQQRPPVECASADQGAPGRQQELRRAGRPRPRAQPGQSGSDDGVLHRRAEASAVKTVAADRQSPELSTHRAEIERRSTPTIPATPTSCATQNPNDHLRSSKRLVAISPRMSAKP